MAGAAGLGSGATGSAKESRANDEPKTRNINNKVANKSFILFF